MIVTSSAPAPTNGRLKKQGPDVGSLDRVLRALNHPVRRRILRALAQEDAGGASASSLAREFKMRLGIVSYHLNQVLANDCEVVELVAMVPRRGAMEKFYKLKRGALTSLFSGPGAEGPLRSLSLEECLLAAVEAIDASASGGQQGGAWEWFSVELDADGWREVQAAQSDFNGRLVRAVENSRSRAGEEANMAAVVGAVALPDPDSSTSVADE